MEEAAKRVLKIIDILGREYPDATTALDFSTPLEMLVSTILSAQSTDKTVNKVTPALFKKYRNAKDFAKADKAALEGLIRSTGFYHNKAKSILGMAKMLVSDFGGKVPDTMEELVKLPGVARKTANVVLNNAFHKSVGIVVDTHVLRLSERLGLSKNTNAVKVEEDLMKIVPKQFWNKISYYLVDHGRAICIAKKPKCPECVISKHCPSYQAFMKKFWNR